jgi:hypothetical protein
VLRGRLRRDPARCPHLGVSGLRGLQRPREHQQPTGVQCQRLFKGMAHHSVPMASATMPATIAAARALTTSEITR